ncbi:uncharacterized protein LOC114297218 [Camellia sinensis]|uniref:Bromo domain-containing protein n=1 Tax=Camellia sinensis var. sinensis TaxID=542762 RepID=A0A4S4DBI9_CAMSN|nr:uncharacterized protein LOC114297218 [Camellia sinensis]THF99927.1 hypothetical protein TEA_002455 [Camellia sinensis var. sinensis]
MVKRKGRGRQKRNAKIQNNNNNINPSTSEQQEQTQQVNAAQHNVPPPPPPGRQPLPGPRRGRKKKRLEEVAFSSIGPTAQQNGEKPKDEIPPVNSVFQSSQQMPEKRILEFILDILQRRDTHEIFAQPVDANEVEGYYDIIEKPMDFGTMRAKLQEGMYSTLEQFESDVFLILNNAMLFNSSTTIYFRQARAIHDLAKRVFQTLKTDPKKFELDSSLSRRRNGRKPQGETRSLHVKLGAKLRGNSLAHRGSSATNPYENEILPGSRDGRNVNFCETGRCQMYKHQSEESSIVLTIYSSSKELVPGNGGIGYNESLLRFAKDLGPTAQNVANQKLSHSFRDSSCLISSSATQQQPNCINGATEDANNPLGSHVSINIDSSACRGKMALGIGGLDKGKSVLTGDSINPNDAHRTQNQLGSYLPGAGTANINGYTTTDWMAGSKPLDDQFQPAHLFPRSQLLEFLSNSNQRPKSSLYPSKVITSSSSNAPPDLNWGASSAQVEWSRPTPCGPQAIYDFSRIQPQQPDEANIYGHDAFAQRGLEVTWTTYAQPQPQPQPGLLNLLGEDIFVQTQQQLPVVSYIQSLPNEVNWMGQDGYVQRGLYPALSEFDVNSVGQNVILPRQTQQLVLACQGLMSDAGNYSEGGSLQGQEVNSNAQLWDFQQQHLRVSPQHPDLDIRLRTQNRRS